MQPIRLIRRHRRLSTVIATGIVAAGALTVPAFSDPGSTPAPTEANRAERPAQRAVLNASQTNLLYNTVTPCKIASFTLKAGKKRDLYAAGSTGFGAQGGKSSGCGLRESAASVVVNVTVSKATKAGQLKAWAFGAPQPTTPALLYPKKSTAMQQLTWPTTPGAGKDLTVRSIKGKVKVTVVVVGYYEAQMHAYISSGGTILDQSGRLLSATRTNDGQYTLTWDRDIASCSGQGSSDVTGHIVSVYTSGNISYIYVVNNAGVYEDYWTNVLITC